MLSFVVCSSFLYCSSPKSKDTKDLAELLDTKKSGAKQSPKNASSPKSPNEAMVSNLEEGRQGAQSPIFAQQPQQPAANQKEDVVKTMSRDFLETYHPESIGPCFDCMLYCFSYCPSLFYKWCDIKQKKK